MTRRTVLAWRCSALLGAAPVGAGAARAAAHAQPPTAADAQLCTQASDGARYPEALARMRAAARAGGAAGAFAEGCVYMGEARYDRASGSFERAVAADGSSAVAHFFLGQAYSARARLANPLKQAGLACKTRDAFERAVALDPDYLDARDGLVSYYLLAPGVLGGSVERARAEAAEIRRRDAYRGGVALAQIAIHERNPEEAAGALEALVRQYPDSAAPYAALATGYERQRRWAEAWEVTERMLRAMPNAPVARYVLGRVAQESGQQLERGAAALARYVAAGEPRPGDPPLANAHWRLGLIYEQQGKKDAARAEFEAALRLDPSLAGAREGLERTR